MRIGLLIAIVILALLVTINSYAFVQFIAPVASSVMWLGRLAIANPATARAIEWSIYGHGALIASIFYQDSQKGAQTTQPVKTNFVVENWDKAKRENPDPKRFNDAFEGRDPTPKQSYAGEADQNYHSLPASGAMVATQPAGTTWTVAVSGQNSYLTYMSVGFSTYAGSSDAQKCAALNTATNPGTGWALTCPAGTSSDGERVALWAKSTAGKNCAVGYTLTNGNCLLTAEQNVMKPEGKVPCEVIANIDGTWDVDKKNPECQKQSNSITNTGNKLIYAKGDGTYDQITKTADGGTLINTGNRTIDLGPPNSSGESPIRGITDGPPGNGGSTPGTGTSPGGGGTGGTGTTPEANCGAPGQPVCDVKVDDSGLDGKKADINAPLDGVKSAHDGILNAMSQSMPKAFDWSWSLPIQPVACQDLVFSVKGFPVNVPYCKYVPLMQQAMSFLAYLFTVAYLFQIATTPASRT